MNPVDPFQISIPYLTQSPSHSPDKKLSFTSTLPTSISHSKFQNRSSPYLVTAFAIASYVGFVPFKVIKKFKSNEDSGSGSDYFIVPLSLFRKFICLVMHLLVISFNVYSNLLQLIFTDPAKFSSNFTRTFDLVASVGGFFLSLSFIYTCWMRQDQLLELIQQTSVPYDRGTERKHKCIAIAMFLVSHSLSLYITTTIVANIPVLDSLWTWPSSEGMTIPDYVLNIGKILGAIFFSHSISIQHFSPILIALLVLSMRAVRKAFCERMTASLEKTDLESGFDCYIALKQLSSNITRTFGTMILFYYIISVAYFAKIPESSVWKQHTRIVGMLSQFGFGAVVWLVSAEFHMNVRDVVQNWATEMQDLDDLTIDTRIRLLNVVNDNLLDPVGISCKFFTITYGFLGSMLGLIVTYAIIVFQMQAKPTSSVTPTPSTFFSTVETTTRNTEL